MVGGLLWRRCPGSPAGLVSLTAVRVCSVSTEPGSGSDD